MEWENACESTQQTKMMYLTNAMSVLLVHWVLYSHWPRNLLPSVSPQEISRKRLGATSDESCTFQHKHAETGVWQEAHLLLLSHTNRNGTNDKQTPCDWRFQQLVTQSLNSPLKHVCVLSLCSDIIRCLPFKLSLPLHVLHTFIDLNASIS